jgi:probable rRNA maturation factor
MSAVVDVQRAIETGPSDTDIEAWVDAVLEAERHPAAELTLRIVDAEESAALNEQYRHKPGPTNVLSFPFENPPGVQLDLLGDVVICAPLVKQEAQQQAKDEQAHWAHLVVHGTLHLLGYDHVQEDEAADMEARETRILHSLGYADPYRLNEEQ